MEHSAFHGPGTVLAGHVDRCKMHHCNGRAGRAWVGLCLGFAVELHSILLFQELSPTATGRYCAAQRALDLQQVASSTSCT